MKFSINRTSYRFCDVQPQPVEGSYLMADLHGRDQVYEYRHWYVILDSLEDLLNLAHKVSGPLVIDAESKEMPHIEIYDDYRE